jgi:hypothetical protein
MRGGINKKRGVSVHSRFAPLASRIKSLRTSGITSFSARTPTYITIIKEYDLIFEFLRGRGFPGDSRCRKFALCNSQITSLRLGAKIPGRNSLPQAD